MVRVRQITLDDLYDLYQYWCDLEVLRSGLYRTPPPTYPLDEWLAATSAMSGWVAEAYVVIAGLLYVQVGAVASVQHLVVDIHHAEPQALGAALWRVAVAAWREGGVCQVEASAKQRLPVEDAFWRACGAETIEGRYVVRLC
ncbi:hypothetical protein CEN41_01790 [Fischerella thermalis CCMEE 5330]|uniref:GNAT family N-acetyltransferase n=1 Tax=Fischerella thermalis CCMEE 5330 TaxID=2019670 RepID=A0A2N6MNF9_9CYAN|nr:hypothetical protein CEN41_01790 [Fischerella thermalis CCMEE 5330]